MSALPDSAQETPTPDTEAVTPPPKPRMSTRNRLLFFATGWLIVLMPFLFWWNTWFGRQLSDKQLAEYLQDDKKPRHIQHALVQIGERVARNDPGVTRWYPDVVRLASYPIEEVRNTDAWVMGQDVSSKDSASAGFHAALLKMLDDSSEMVRGNAALSLVRFGDATGRPHIVALLQPAKVSAPRRVKSLIRVPWGRLFIKAESLRNSSLEDRPLRYVRQSAAGCARYPRRPDRRSPLETKSQPLIRGRNRSGKLCARYI